MFSTKIIPSERAVGRFCNVPSAATKQESSTSIAICTSTFGEENASLMVEKEVASPFPKVPIPRPIMSLALLDSSFILLSRSWSTLDEACKLDIIRKRPLCTNIRRGKGRVFVYAPVSKILFDSSHVSSEMEHIGLLA